MMKRGMAQPHRRDRREPWRAAGLQSCPGSGLAWPVCLSVAACLSVGACVETYLGRSLPWSHSLLERW